ncbi:MAG: M16 family metallopeptidase [Janthinobacterium lividum]
MRHRLIGFAAAAALLAASVPVRADAPAGLSGAVPGGVLRATLPNGLRVVVVPDRLAPVVSTELNYLAGSNDAPDGFPGTAHALEHMMFRGSAGLDRAQLAEVGALLGGVYNADTTETVTQYTYTVPADDLGVALRSEALRMRGLSITPEDWAQERGAIEQEVSRDLSSPVYDALAQMQAILFEGTPYAHDALGTRPSFDRTDAPLLRAFYERWYAPNNAILVIAGDVDPPAALAEAQAAFGDIPARPVPEHAAFTVGPVQARTLALATDFPVGLVALGMRMPGLTTHDFAAADVLGDVLGSQRGALYGLVPEGRALLTQFRFQAKPGVGFGLAIGAFPRGGDPAPLLADMRRVLADAARDGVPAELVEAARRQELAQLAFESDSIAGLARSWSRVLAFQGADSPEDLARAYAAVTPDDVNRLARTLLDPAATVTAVLTPRSSGKPVTGAGFGGAESFGAPPDHPVVLPQWAADALAGLHLPAAPEPPDVSVLPNGLRLVVQPEHVSHTVTVQGRVRSEDAMQEPAGQEGVASLAAALFDQGTETRDRLALLRATDDIAAQEQAGPAFSVRVLAPEFAHGMALLAENELRPAFLSPTFPEATFARVRDQLAQGVSGALQSPDYLFRHAVAHALAPDGDPSLREPTPATLSALHPDDVRAYYAAAYRPDLTTLVVLGDVSVAEARRVVAETFGGWAAAGPTPAIDLPPATPSVASQARVPDESSLQDSVMLAESVGLPVDSPDRYTLMLGNVVLGGGFSSRLYRNLRVRTGYVYTVKSALDWSRTRADYSVTFGADPQNVTAARALAVHDIAEMQAAPVPDAELARAKAQVLRRLPMQRDSVGAIAGLYLHLAELGLPLDSDQIAARRYLEITAPEIRQAFATWLRPADLAQVVKGPSTAQ